MSYTECRYVYWAGIIPKLHLRPKYPYNVMNFPPYFFFSLKEALLLMQQSPRKDQAKTLQCQSDGKAEP